MIKHLFWSKTRNHHACSFMFCAPRVFINVRFCSIMFCVVPNHIKSCRNKRTLGQEVTVLTRAECFPSSHGMRELNGIRPAPPPPAPASRTRDRPWQTLLTRHAAKTALTAAQHSWGREKPYATNLCLRTGVVRT